MRLTELEVGSTAGCASEASKWRQRERIFIGKFGRQASQDKAKETYANTSPESFFGAAVRGGGGRPFLHLKPVSSDNCPSGWELA